MKKVIIYISILVILLSACTSDAKTKDSTPPSLQSLMDLSEDLLTSIENKDIHSSVNIIKSMHFKWNSFYTFIINNESQNQNSDLFNSNLNILTDSLITMQKAELAKNKIEDSEDKGSEDKGSEDKGSEDKGSEDKGSEDKGSEDKGSEDDFLDETTQKVDTIKELQNLYYAVQITKNTAIFLSHYDTSTYPQILLIKYYIRNIQINSQLNKFDDLNNSITKIQTIYKTIQPMILSNNKDLSTQFEITLDDLKKNINNKNVIDIKCQIALKNIEEMINIKSEQD